MAPLLLPRSPSAQFVESRSARHRLPAAIFQGDPLSQLCLSRGTNFVCCETLSCVFVVDGKCTQLAALTRLVFVFMDSPFVRSPSIFDMIWREDHLRRTPHATTASPSLTHSVPPHRHRQSPGCYFYAIRERVGNSFEGELLVSRGGLDEGGDSRSKGLTLTSPTPCFPHSIVPVFTLH